jgi:predicted ATPase
LNTVNTSQKSREGLTAKIEAGLESSQGSVVTLVGEPGIGKSHLAQSFVRGKYQIPFCLDLNGIVDEAGVLRCLTNRLHESGIQPQGDTLSLEESSHHIQGDVLVLDNAEGLSRLPATLVNTLRGDRACLVTSRQPIGVRGETVLTVEALSQEEAIDLFRECASHISESNERLEDAEAIARIIRGLGGNPLAIKMAAARTKIMTLDQIVDRLKNRFDLLHSTGEDERYESLRSAFDASWDMLTEDGRRSFARSSIFEGPFTLQSFETIARDEQPQNMMQTLQQLVEACLIHRTHPATGGAPTAFEITPSLRAYAMEKLEEMGALEETAGRLISLGQEILSSWQDDTTPLSSEWDLENSTDVSLAMTAMMYADRFSPEDGDALRKAIRDLTEKSPTATVTNLFSHTRVPAIEYDDGADPTPEWLYQRGESLLERGETLHALETLRNASAIVQKKGDRSLGIRIYRTMARAHLRKHNTRAAAQCYQRAAQLAEALGDDQVEIAMRTRLGRIFLTMELFEEARPPLQRVLELMTTTGQDTHGQITRQRVMRYLTMAHIEFGDYHAARTVCEEALLLPEVRGNSRRQAAFRGLLGRRAYRLGRLTEALRELDLALSLLSKVDDRSVDIYTDRLAVLLGLGHTDALSAAQEPVLEIDSRIGFDPSRALLLALSKLQLGDAPGARSRIHDCLTEVQRRSRKSHESRCLVALSATYAAEGHQDEATRILRAAKDRLVGVSVAGELAISTVEALLALSDPDADLDELENWTKTIDDRLRDEETPTAGLHLFWTHWLFGLLCNGLEAQGRTTTHDDSNAILVGPDAHWFRPPGGERVVMTRKRVLRHLLIRLIDAHRNSPGIHVEVEDLFESAWPEELAIRHDSKANRLRVSMTRLRGLGLDEVLLQRYDGYLLNPAAVIKECD